LLARLPPGPSLDGDPPSPRPSARRRWRCTSIAAGTYIGKLEAEGVIQRQGSGFPLDQSRVVYLRYLRRERRQSPRAEADAAHVAVKTEVLQLQLTLDLSDVLGRERLRYPSPMLRPLAYSDQ
jgi:hypothetical protein